MYAFRSRKGRGLSVRISEKTSEQTAQVVFETPRRHATMPSMIAGLHLALRSETPCTSQEGKNGIDKIGGIKRFSNVRVEASGPRPLLVSRSN